MIGNVCQAGHKKHDTLKVETGVGPMFVYDYEKYKDIAGYCTGKDDVSRTLINEGAWEKPETEIVKGILENGNRNNLLIDIGCHIGWYSILAGKMGYQVKAIDGDKENIKTLKANAILNSVVDKISTFTIWIDGEIEKLKTAKTIIELIKIDIEGNEVYAINLYQDWLKEKRVRNLFIEFSPVFNNSYPDIYKRLMEYGYKAFKNGRRFDGEMNFNQANILFKL